MFGGEAATAPTTTTNIANVKRMVVLAIRNVSSNLTDSFYKDFDNDATFLVIIDKQTSMALPIVVSPLLGGV